MTDENDKWENLVGKRLLIEYNGLLVNRQATEARLLEISPSGNYLCLEHLGGRKEWIFREIYSVKEILNDKEKL